MKNKVKDSFLLTVCDLPKEDIKDLGLSYRDIGIRCNNIIKKYSLNNIKNDKDLIKNQQKLRRDLSNWVNDPKNLANSQGKYIGDKFGARITICLADGTVIQDVQTFCRDVKNKNNRILGQNNSYIFLKSEPVSIDVTDKKRFLYSTFNVDGLNNSSVKYENVYAYKVNSSTVPSSNQNSSVMQYSPDETSNEITNIVSGELLDLHTTRKEYIQATTRRYGYNSRATESIVTTDHHVCKYVENIQGLNDIYCRLTYFDFPAPTIIDVAVADGRFTTLYAAVKAADLAETLSGPGPFTVFAPTDTAFGKLPAGMVADLLKPENLTQLAELLKYHLVDGKVMAADVVKLSFTKTLADGLNVSIRVENGKVLINDSQVIITDIPCANGVIHVIDTVLSKQTTYNLLVGSKKFNTLVAALGTAGLATALSGPGPFTVFAPTDKAWAKYPKPEYDALFANPGRLNKLLLYHVLPEKVTATAAQWSNIQKQTMAGPEFDVTLSVKDDGKYVNDILIGNEIVGSNGVIHVIDNVLIIPPVF